MSLIDDLKKAEEDGFGHGGVRCASCTALDDVPPKELEALNDAVAKSRVPITAAARILQDNGYAVSTASLRSHYRNGHHLR